MTRAEKIKEDVLEAVYRVVCKQAEDGKMSGATASDVKGWFVDNEPMLAKSSLPTIRDSLSLLHSEGAIQITNPGKGPCKKYIDV